MDQGSIGHGSTDQPKLTEEDYLATKRQLDLALARITELEAKLEEATVWAERAIEDVVERDQRIRQHGQLERELQEQSQAANRTLAVVYRTKVWRVATVYWRARDRIRWLLGRRVSPNGL